MSRWLKAAVVGLSIGLIGIGLALTQLGAKLEEQIGLTWLFKVRGAIAPPSDVVVIAIDGRTGNKLGLPKLPRDWPRSIHATVVDHLSELDASAIVFDIDFRRARDEEEDKAFAAAMRRSNRVVLVESLEGVKQPLDNTASWTESVQATPPDGEPPGSKDMAQTEGRLWVEQLIPPAEVLAEAAFGMGTFPVPKTQGAVYQYWAFKPSAGDAPTIPAVALQVHAMAVYEGWRRMLAEAGGRGAAGLPATSRDIRSARALREAMVTMRRSFLDDSELIQRLGQEVEHFDGAPDKTKLLRALHTLYSGDDNRYLNFYGTPGTITTIPYHLVVGEQWKSLDVRDNVVFVGFSDVYNPGQQDWFHSVFTSDEGVDLSGVEIAATAFGNLLNGQGLVPADTAATILIVSLFGAVLGAGIYILPAIVAVPIALAIAALYGYGVQYAFSNLHLWLPLTTPLLVQLPMAVFLGLLTNYLFERRQKREVTEAIAYFLPEHVVADLGRGSFNPDSLDKVVYATCLATDMAGFTAITESMPPDKSASFINNYFESLAAPLKKYDVSVTEFRADGIMCAWTAPGPEESVRRAAVLAALETRDAILQFGDRSKTPLRARIGLDADFVYIGHAGGGGHFAYSIVGDAANTAARIETLNEQLKTQLLATDAVTAGIEGLLLRPLGEFKLKGKKEVVSVIEVVARASVASREQHSLCGRFADALAAFRNERWSEAAKLFQDIVARFPDDGPSLLYLDHSKQYIRHPPERDRPAVIHMGAR